MNAPGHTCACVFAVAVACVSGVKGATCPAEGAVEKKIVAFGWEFGQTPSISNLLLYADEFDKTPLDGIGFALSDVPCADGYRISSRYIMHGRPWKYSEVSHLVPQLRKLTAHRSMRECFIGSLRSPTNRIDWTDDAAWTRIANNLAVTARLAKEGGLRGLAIDHEDYFRQEQYFRQGGEMPFDKLAALVRRRGRELFSAVFREYPDVTLITFWMFSQHAGYFGTREPLAAARSMGDLWPSLMNGIFDAMPPCAKFIDGDERSYRYEAETHDFIRAVHQQRDCAIGLVAPENRVKFLSQMRPGCAVFLDMYTNDPKSSWYRGPVDGSRLNHLERNLHEALSAAGEYVWLWGQSHTWMPYWKQGIRLNGYIQKSTWEECLPGLNDTIRSLRDPDGCGSARLAAMKAAGAKPINPNPECADLKGGKVPPPYSTWQDTLKRRTNGVFRLDTAFGEGDASSLCAVGVPYGSFVFPVRGLKTGEWLAVELSAKGDIVTANIGWQMKGKWCKGLPGTPIPLDGDFEGWKRGRAFVRVPAGADGFGMTMGVRQREGEKAWFDNIRVYRIKEADNPASAGKEMKK